MPINPAELAGLIADYSVVTGRTTQSFVCPITFRTTGTLSHGHVLNHAIRDAARATVIQYKEVDSYFGATVEPDLITFANLPILPFREHLEKAKKCRWAVRRAGDSRGVEVPILHPSGEPSRSPFTRKVVL